MTAMKLNYFYHKDLCEKTTEAQRHRGRDNIIKSSLCFRASVVNLLCLLCFLLFNFSTTHAQITITRQFTGLNLTIPDNNSSGIANVQSITAGTPGLIVTDVNVSLQIEGPGARNGDLYVSLQHENTFSVLLNRVGRDTDRPLGYGDAGMKVKLDDGAANGDIHAYRLALFGNHDTAIGAPLDSVWAGTFSPDGRPTDPESTLLGSNRAATLSSLNGAPVDGDWKLFLADIALGALNTLKSWELEITGALPGAEVPIGFQDATIRAEGDTRTISNPVTVQGAVQLQGSANQVFESAIGGSGGLTKFGAGQLILYGANTFSGGVALNEGALVLGEDRALGFGKLTLGGGELQSTGGPRSLSNPVSLSGDATFGGSQPIQFNGLATLEGSRNLRVNNTTIFSGDIGESGGSSILTKTGSGSLILQGANTFSGGVTLDEGKLVLGNDQALGTGPLTLRGGGTLEASGGSRILNNPVSLVGGANISGATPLQFSGPATLGGDSALSVQNVTTFSGTIQDGPAPAKLSKSGTGTLVLSGANTFSGGVALEEGVLVVNNSSGSATGTGPVSIQNGGALKGSGIISGSLTLQSGGRVGPGTSPGTLTTGSATWIGGAIYQWEMNQASVTAGAHPGWDLWQINGGLTVQANAANPFKIQVTSLTLADLAGRVHDFNGQQNYTWTIARATDGITGATTDAFSIDLAEWTAPDAPGFFTISQSGNELQINYVVPEPASTLIIGSLLLLALAIRPLRVLRREDG